MKKIYLFLVAVMLTVSAEAQYSITTHPESSDQVAVQFPNQYTIGQFLATYSGPGMPAFNGTDITILPFKNNAILTNYSKIQTTAQLVLIYTDAYGPHNDPYVVNMIPDLAGVMKVSLHFMTIAPLDGQISIVLRVQLNPGAYTLYDDVRTIATVSGGGGVTSSSVWSGNTFVKQMLIATPASVSDRVITELPQFSQIVGTFDLTSPLAVDINDIQMQLSGQINGAMPMLVNPRIVDENYNTIANGYGVTSNQIGLGITPALHFSANEHKRIYVLSDMLNATNGDFVRLNIQGGCGTILPFGTVVSTTFACENDNALLGERVVYQPVTEVSTIEGSNMVTVFPNPVDNQFTVSCEGDWDLTIVDVLGNVVMKSFGNNGIKTFDRGPIVPGQYFFRIVRGGNYPPPPVKQVILN